jgi:peptidoglycan/LPS O-acetylase OafA/YrhL
MFPDLWTALLGTFLVYVTIVLVLATLLYRYVELPFINWGKRITAKMRSSVEF